jgi:hypothetical protein
MAFSPTAIQYRSLAKPPRTPRTTAKKKTGRLRGWWNHGYAPKIMPDQPMRDNDNGSRSPDQTGKKRQTGTIVPVENP